MNDSSSLSTLMHLSAGKERGNQWSCQGGHRGIQTVVYGLQTEHTLYGDLKGGGGSCRDRNKGVCLTKRACVEYYSTDRRNNTVTCRMFFIKCQFGVLVGNMSPCFKAVLIYLIRHSTYKAKHLSDKKSIS